MIPRVETHREDPVAIPRLLDLKNRQHSRRMGKLRHLTVDQSEVGSRLRWS